MKMIEKTEENRQVLGRECDNECDHGSDSDRIHLGCAGALGFSRRASRDHEGILGSLFAKRITK